MKREMERDIPGVSELLQLHSRLVLYAKRVREVRAEITG